MPEGGEADDRGAVVHHAGHAHLGAVGGTGCRPSTSPPAARPLRWRSDRIPSASASVTRGPTGRHRRAVDASARSRPPRRHAAVRFRWRREPPPRVLARCALGKPHVVQVGDYAEDPDASDPRTVRRTVALIDALAGVRQMSTGTPAVRVGRMAGQYAKPRSRPVETWPCCLRWTRRGGGRRTSATTRTASGTCSPRPRVTGRPADRPLCRAGSPGPGTGWRAPPAHVAVDRQASGSWPQFIRECRHRVSRTSPGGRWARWRRM
ncbi:3-deoxy-7-phosphoheptulonate synthase [Streptomyces sp. WELS2]|uniref:3-deoxy-7-phosphoheptulonate synthase n=1 Tax=Streptomyces sp. WELS2 TaxID=2749435 RepID=UPI002867B3C1|nr:3-deoxy-7-phosphoheptulonate synthase [Streptomyces sp. WELS2]